MSEKQVAKAWCRHAGGLRRFIVSPVFNHIYYRKRDADVDPAYLAAPFLHFSQKIEDTEASYSITITTITGSSSQSERTYYLTTAIINNNKDVERI